MITYIIGDRGKSTVAEGIADMLKKQGKTPVVFHERATGKQIESAIKTHSDVIACFNEASLPFSHPPPDILIEIILYINPESLGPWN